MSEPKIAGFGFSTGTIAPDLDGLDELLGRIAATGAGFAELSLFQHDLIVAGRVRAERRRQLERICARHRLRYTVHGMLGTNFMDEAHLELHKAVCAAMLELCAAVGASVLVQHAGRTPRDAQAELDRRHALERTALAELGDLAARHGVRIAVENLFVQESDVYSPDPLRLARELAAIDHEHVMGTLDFSHAYLTATQQGIDFEAAVRALAPHANHLHLHDSFGRPPTLSAFHGLAERIAYGMGDLHLPLGWGDIPWERLVTDLPVRAGTAMIVELPPHFWRELDAVAETTRALVERANRA